MMHPSRHDQRSPIDWLRRLDRTAARMNPFLAMLAVGLTVLNLVSFALMAPRLPIYRLATDRLACPTTAISEIGSARPASATGAPSVIQ